MDILTLISFSITKHHVSAAFKDMYDTIEEAHIQINLGSTK